MEKEFSMKDFFLYSARRWFYFLLLVMLCVIIAAGVSLVQRVLKKSDFTMQASAIICDMETYAAQNPELNADTIPGAFNESRKRAFAAMTDEYNYFLFVSKDANLAVVGALTGEASVNPNDALRLLKENLVVTEKLDRINAEITYNALSKWEAGNVKALLNAYTGFMIERAYEDVPRFAQMHSAAGSPAEEPFQSGTAKLIAEDVPESKTLENAFLGAGAGFLAAVVLAVALYFADPKLKSAGELTGLGFPLLVDMPDADFSSAGLAALLPAADGVKRIFVTGTDGAKTGGFSKAFAAFLNRSDYKTLLVDGSTTGGRLQQFLSGGKFADAVEKDENGVDTVSFTESGDFARLLSGKERLAELDGVYDKIVICCDAGKSAGAVAVCSALSDAVVMLADKRSAKSKNILAAKAQIVDSVTVTAGVAYAGEDKSA